RRRGFLRRLPPRATGVAPGPDGCAAPGIATACSGLSQPGWTKNLFHCFNQVADHAHRSRHLSGQAVKRIDSKSAKSCIRTSAAQEADNDVRNFLGKALVDGRDEDQNEYDYPETVYRQSTFAFATWLFFEFVFDNVMLRICSSV